ncbi:hypothetical protein ACFUMH_01655 [Cellulomonas sp. NPDC057328]|uniref:hypothetical protein n=1 Tax=Cellulomonas sp. NPDC057328 TaxID=3346101 RepID=UPI0036403851
MTGPARMRRAQRSAAAQPPEPHRTHRPARTRALRRRAALVVAALLATAGALPPAHAAAPPSAAPPTAPSLSCDYDTPGVPVLVPGDLRVYPGCPLGYTVVLGDLHVLPEAQLTFRGRVAGDVHVNEVASLLLQSAEVGGGVHLDRATDLTVLQSTVGRSIRGKAQQMAVDQSVVHGAINVATRQTAPWELRVRGSWVGGWVNLHTGQVRVIASVLRRGLTASWAHGVQVCASEIGADLVVRHAQRAVRVGGPAWQGDCVTGPTTRPVQVGGDVQVLDNDDPVALEALDVTGDLLCTGNRTAPALGAVTVAGVRGGQCAG